MADPEDIAVSVAEPNTTNPTAEVSQPVKAVPVVEAKEANVPEPAPPVVEAEEAAEPAPAEPVKSPPPSGSEDAVGTGSIVSAIIFMILGTSVGFIVGGILLNVGIKQSGTKCDARLDTFAVVYGSLLICNGGLAILAGVLASLGKKGAGQSKVVSNALIKPLQLAMLGVFIWGTVLAFSENRWNNVMVSQPASGPPCTKELYEPVAIILIVMWSFAGVLIPILLCVGCCALCCGIMSRK